MRDPPTCRSRAHQPPHYDRRMRKPFPLVVALVFTFACQRQDQAPSPMVSQRGASGDRGFLNASNILAVADLDARPHWGKEMPPLTPADVDTWYPRAPQWRALVHELDPRGMFGNARVDQIVGPRPS